MYWLNTFACAGSEIFLELDIAVARSILEFVRDVIVFIVHFGNQLLQGVTLTSRHSRFDRMHWFAFLLHAAGVSSESISCRVGHVASRFVAECNTIKRQCP